MGLGAWRSGIFPPGVKFVKVVLEFVLKIGCVRNIFICFVLLPSTTAIFLTILWAEESQFWPGAFTCPFSFHSDKVRWWLGDIYGLPPL